MKTTVCFYIGIVTVGVVSAASFFALVPQENLKGPGTEFEVPFPDEMDEKANCFSRGTWDDANCNLEPEPKNFSEHEISHSCVGCFGKNKELVEAFKEKYFEFGIIEYDDSHGIPYKYSVKTSNRDVELILGLDRNVLRSFEKDTGASVCTIINPFPQDVFDYCPPKW